MTTSKANELAVMEANERFFQNYKDKLKFIERRRKEIQREQKRTEKWQENKIARFVGNILARVILARSVKEIFLIILLGKGQIHSID